MKSFEKLELLRAAVCVVGADGEIEESESDLIDKLADAIGVGRASREAMLNRGKSDPNFCNEMFRVLKTDPKETMITLFQAAMVDGVLADSEIRVLKNFADKLGLEDAHFETLVQQARDLIEKNADQ